VVNQGEELKIDKNTKNKIKNRFFIFLNNNSSARLNINSILLNADLAI
jgi:hypothetical protein